MKEFLYSHPIVRIALIAAVVMSVKMTIRFFVRAIARSRKQLWVVGISTALLCGSALAQDPTPTPTPEPSATPVRSLEERAWFNDGTSLGPEPAEGDPYLRSILGVLVALFFAVAVLTGTVVISAIAVVVRI